MIKRLREDDKKITVYGNRGKHIKCNLNPKFPPFKIETQKLCNNDEYRPIIIEIWDWDSLTSDDYIGSVQKSLHELKNMPKKLQILKKKNNKNKKKGELNILLFKSENVSSFLDYMQAEVDMSLMVAIDFTASNGNPSNTSSLHYISDNKPSKYQSAIRQIGNILSVYDTDQKYPVWGFGARFNKIYHGTMHDFNLNLNINDPEVNYIMFFCINQYNYNYKG